MAVPVYLDCDTGIDDALALLYLLRSPEVRLVGIGTVHGNIDAVTAARNTLDLVELAGARVPVAVGATDPRVGSYTGGAPLVHGRNGIGGQVLPRATAGPGRESAADMLVRLADEYEGALEILAVGPLTNIAAALDLAPDLPAKVKRVVVMGGAALAPGNATAVAEENIRNDPEAAALVMATPWETVLVPLDVTRQHRFDDADRDALLASPSAATRAVGGMLDHYLGYYEEVFGLRECALHDPLAAAVVVGEVVPTRAPAVPVVVDVTDGPGRGQTICDMRSQIGGGGDVPGAHVRVVLSTDRSLGPLLRRRLLSEGARSSPVSGGSAHPATARTR